MPYTRVFYCRYFHKGTFCQYLPGYYVISVRHWPDLFNEIRNKKQMHTNDNDKRGWPEGVKVRSNVVLLRYLR